MKILVIEIQRMGEVLQSIPLIRGLKQINPRAKVSVLASRSEALVVSGLSEVDRVVELDTKEIVTLLNTSGCQETLQAVDLLMQDLSPILAEKWDWVINLSHCTPSALLCCLANGQYVSGFRATCDRQYVAREKWFTFWISAFVHNSQVVFNRVDIDKHMVNLPSPLPSSGFPIEDELAQRVNADLKEIGFDGKMLIGIGPGSSESINGWPLEKFESLGERLTCNHDYRIIIFGDERQTYLGRHMRKVLGANCLDLMGKGSIPVLAAYLSRCKVLVTNDNGLAHIAATVGTPVVGLFFSTHFAQTGPYGAGHVAIYPDIACLPCQGTRGCSDKVCTGYISVGTVEKVVCNYNNLVLLGDVIHLDDEPGSVSGVISFFDPWGNLDWRPIDKRLPKAFDVVRVAYKALWLGSLRDREDINGAFDRHLDLLAEAFGKCDQSPPVWSTMSELFELQQQLARLESHFDKAQQLAIRLYQALADGDSREATRIGGALETQEEAILVLGQNDWLNPLVEYEAIQRGRITAQDLGLMAIKKAEFYEEGGYLAAGLRLRLTQVMMRLFPEQTHPVGAAWCIHANAAHGQTDSLEVS